MFLDSNSFAASATRSRSRPDANKKDSDDANWLIARISVRAGSMISDVQRAVPRADELRDFANELAELYRRLDGTARLTSTEGWIPLRITARPNGSLDAGGSVLDSPGNGNELTFGFDDLDQSDPPPLIADPERAPAGHPVMDDTRK